MKFYHSKYSSEINSCLYPKFLKGYTPDSVHVITFVRFKHEGIYYLFTMRAMGYSTSLEVEPLASKMIEALEPQIQDILSGRTTPEMVTFSDVDEYQGEFPDLQLQEN